MNLREQFRKDDMEQLLVATITGIIQDFEKQTGLSVSAIDIKMGNADNASWIIEGISTEVTP